MDLHIHTTLWIISKDADAQAIHSLVEDRLPPLRTVEVFNGVEGSEVSRKLAQCDLCVVPSINPETGSRAVVEAQSQHIPVIVTNVVGNHYLIRDGMNGRVVQAGDAVAFKKALEEAVNNPTMISRWAKQAIQPIDKDAWIKKYLDLFEQVRT